MRPFASFLPVLGVAFLISACGGSDGATPPPAPTATTITVDQPTLSLNAVGATGQLAATVKDQNGQAMSGQTVSWASDAAAVATAGSTGLVTAVANGVAHVTVTLGSLSASSTVTVAQVAASMAMTSGDAQSAAPGAALPDSVVVLVADANGHPVSGATVGFQATAGGGSASPSSAATGSNGHAAAVWTLGTAGAQSLTATSAGLTGSPVTFTANASNVSLVSIVPDTITEAASVTINGTGFSATLTDNVVMVDGVAAIVTAATPTQLTITVPTYDCRPTRNVNVQVTVSGAASNLASAPIRPAAYTVLAIGQQVIVQSPSAFCFQFAPDAAGTDEYLIGVGAAAETPTALNTLTLTGTAGAGPSSAIAPAPTLRVNAPTFGAGIRAPLTPVQQEIATRWARQYHSDASIRAYDAALFQRARPYVLRPARSIAAPTISATPVVPTVGAIVSYRVPLGPDFCNDYADIGAVVKYVGTSGVWVSDTANPKTVDSLSDAEIQGYSDTLDTKIYATDTAYFGAPSDIDGNGRIIIILSKEVNEANGGGIAGFVFSGDLFSRAACASSNSGEIFYGQVPDPDNVSGTGARSKAAVVGQMPSLIAHEFTHDIQNSRRIIISPTAGSNVYMNSWEAEGQAMFAQNAVGDAVLGNTSGQNYGASTLFATQGARWYEQAFSQLAEYFGYSFVTSGRNANAPEQCTLFGGGLFASNPTPCGSDAFYGAAYAFEKYITDRYGPTYPGGEKGLHHDIIYKNPGLAGSANWATTVGFNFDSLFAQWGAMLYVDDRVPGISAPLQMTSWNLNQIFGPTGYNNTNAYLIPFPQNWGGFTVSKSVRDGSTFYTLLNSTGPHPALAVKARDGSNTPLAVGMAPQFWIVRIK